MKMKTQNTKPVQFSSVQSLSRVQLFATPWIAAHQWDPVKAVLRGRFIAIEAYLKKQEKSQINNLTLNPKQQEKEEMKNPRVSRRKEILKLGQK